MKRNLWNKIKFKGDVAIYAQCKCGYHYACSRLVKKDESWVNDEYKFYPYCPMCGVKKRFIATEVTKIDEFEWDYCEAEKGDDS